MSDYHACKGIQANTGVDLSPSNRGLACEEAIGEL